jgi:hypothetical protein
MGDTNLQIIPYYKPDGNQRNNGDDAKIFTVDFNPSTFTINNKIGFKAQGGQGSAGGDPTFDKIPPLEFSIEFTIDGTGVASQNLSNEQKNKFNSIQSGNQPENKNDYVKTRIRELRETTGSNINGDIHRPNYLAVLWGTFYIKCVLTALNITYNLFDRSGSPLRAKVNCSFLERKQSGAGERQTMYESPDLTKYKQIKQGDKLPLMAKKNYDESFYYLQVAKANKLKNFRSLLPGTTLVLPPLAETADSDNNDE